ncbi:MAG: hypothetical protein ACK5JH_01675 [Anaerocolumna sp.]
MKQKKYKYFINILILLPLICSMFLSCSRKEDKIYSKTVKDNIGDITVTITLTDNKQGIGTLLVNVSKEGSTDERKAAARRIAKTIVAKQSLTITPLTGAEETCKAVLEATNEALLEAGVDTQSFKD